MKRRAAAVLALCLTALVAPTAASNAAAPAWKGPLALPSGADITTTAQAVPDPAGGALLYYKVYGVPTVSRISASGALSAPVQVPAVPALGNSGTPGQIAFLPNGGAVVSWVLNSYGPYMAYRSPSGKFGAPVALPGFGLAVRTGEILTEADSATGIAVDSWKLTSAGVITHTSGPTNVYAGHVYTGHNPAAISLDASGSADIVVYGSTDNYTTEQVSSVFRNAHGTWQPQTQLSAASVTSVSFATSPGGRAIVAWVESPANTAATMRAAIRKPGDPFGATTTTGSVSSPNTVAIFPLVAAGPDGTLAVATSSKVYTTGTAYTTSTNVRIAAPKATSLGGAHGVPESNDALTLSALGAGHSQAITGLLKAVAGPGDGVHPSSYTYSQSTIVSIISASSAVVTKTFGSSAGTYDGNGGEGCGCGTSPPPASVMGVSLDSTGQAAVVGELTPADVLKYGTRAGVAAAKPKVIVKSKHATATASKIPVTLSCAKAACKGTLTLTAKVGKKTVRLARSSYSIKAGKHKTIKAKLTKAGKKAVKHAKTHHVHAKAIVTVKGGAKVTKSLTVT